MSSRATLNHTPAGMLGLILPVAAFVLLGVVAVAQRSPNSVISLSQPESHIVAAKIAAADPSLQPNSEPTLCYPDSAVDSGELHRHKLKRAYALTRQLEQQAATSPDGATTISITDLRMLRSALTNSSQATALPHPEQNTY